MNTQKMTMKEAAKHQIIQWQKTEEAAIRRYKEGRLTADVMKRIQSDCRMKIAAVRSVMTLAGEL